MKQSKINRAQMNDKKQISKNLLNLKSTKTISIMMLSQITS